MYFINFRIFFFGFMLCFWVYQEAISAPLPLAFIDTPITIESKDGKREIFVSLAHSRASHKKGLMEQTHLPPSHGMLFLFQQYEETFFWMKDTPLPLDIVFITPESIIGHIVTHTTPYSLKVIPSVIDTMAVIEVNAGLIDRLSIAVGDKVTIPDEVRYHDS